MNIEKLHVDKQDGVILKEELGLNVGKKKLALNRIKEMESSEERMIKDRPKTVGYPSTDGMTK
jgi:hypothetical protein